MLLSQLEAELERQGFVFVRQTGAHRVYRDWLGRPLTIAIHGRAIKHPGQVRAIRADLRARRKRDAEERKERTA